jgi:hypothetical protein
VKVERWEFVAAIGGCTPFGVHNEDLNKIESWRRRYIADGYRVSAIQHHVYEVPSK